MSPRPVRRWKTTGYKSRHWSWLVALVAIGPCPAVGSAWAGDLAGPSTQSAPSAAAPVPGLSPVASVTIPASAFRIVRAPAIDAELTPGGQVVPGGEAGVYLALAADSLGDPALTAFGELRAPLSAENGRVAARLMASGEPVAALLQRQTEDVYTPTFDGARERCTHAHFDVLVLSLPLVGFESMRLRAMREDVSQRSAVEAACARPHPEI